MTDISRLEQLVCGHATSQCFSGWPEGFNTWFDVYQYLEQCIEQNIDPERLEMNRWFAYENWRWKDLYEHIGSEATALLRFSKGILSAAHKGIVQSAIDGSLGLDMTQLDHVLMVEKGLCLETEDETVKDS